MTLEESRLLNLLSKLPLFNDLEAPELQQIAAATKQSLVPRGEMVFARGDACEGFHCVVFGQVKLAFQSPQGSEKVVEIIGPGHSFGEALMFMEKPYVLSAHTIEDSLLLHVSKEVIFSGLAKNPQFARKMLAGLSRRLHGLICDVEAYSLNSATQRVIGYLLREEPQGELVVLPASKMIVASRLNVTPEHFSRILHDLSEQGMIVVNGRDITILDMAALRAYQK